MGNKRKWVWRALSTAWTVIIGLLVWLFGGPRWGFAFMSAAYVLSAWMVYRLADAIKEIKAALEGE